MKNILKSLTAAMFSNINPMVSLRYDIERTLNAGLSLTHLNTKPISVMDVALRDFGRRFDHVMADIPVAYDM